MSCCVSRRPPHGRPRNPTTARPLDQPSSPVTANERRQVKPARCWRQWDFLTGGHGWRRCDMDVKLADWVVAGRDGGGVERMDNMCAGCWWRRSAVRASLLPAACSLCGPDLGPFGLDLGLAGPDRSMPSPEFPGTQRTPPAVLWQGVRSWARRTHIRGPTSRPV